MALPDESNVFVTGFGFPCENTNIPLLGSWLNADHPIAAGYTLTNIITQRNFTFFLDWPAELAHNKLFAEPLPEPFKLPYGTVLKGLDGYRDPIRKNKGPQFSPSYT